MKGSSSSSKTLGLVGHRADGHRSEEGVSPRHGVGKRSEPGGPSALGYGRVHTDEPALGRGWGTGAAGRPPVLGVDPRNPDQPDLEPRSTVQRGHCTSRPSPVSDPKRAGLEP